MTRLCGVRGNNMAIFLKKGLQYWFGVRGLASFQRRGLTSVNDFPDKTTDIEQMQANTKTIQAPPVGQSQFNVRAVTKHIEVQSTSDRSPLTDNRPLVLLFSWLYASRKVLDKHRVLYHRRGYDVLTVKGDPRYAFSTTGFGSKIAIDALKFLKADGRPKQPLLVHSVSVGFVPYAMLLKHAQENMEYADVPGRVVGQVMDGPVGDTKGAAVGVGRSINNPVGKMLYTGAVWSFFTFVPGVLKSHDFTRSYWETQIPKTPILLYGCHNDPMSTKEYNERCVEGWRKLGCDVRLQFWDDSSHSNHMRLHRDEYVSALDNYLDTLDLEL
ncbi:Hypp695 [Branchiostoma lanceolatum]|uniref:Hypp695 protein n=1 Tax=Branchiostoma lanceolatum TaxID=7740 RepID=A0A8J9VNG6_BRALA|nr:Hypp695 [Branchiostoma lanceolatum]